MLCCKILRKRLAVIKIFGNKKLKHGGWEDPSCQLRGHFLGHWLSAAAIHYDETGNQALLGKANEIDS